MKTATLVFKSKSALIMHSARGADPLDKDAIAHKRLTSKRTKTEDDHQAIAKSEWRLGLYWDQKLGPYLPTNMLSAALHSGAKLFKKGAAFGRTLLIDEERVPLLYDGPRDPEKLFTNSAHVDIAAVVVSGRRVMRCRPIFPQWEVKFTVYYDETVLELSDIVQAAQNAGQFCGLGDNRPSSPKRPGPFGRFVVEVEK